MKFEVWQEGISVKPAMIIEAENHIHAWKVLRRAGIRNKSKLMRLVEIDD